MSYSSPHKSYHIQGRSSILLDSFTSARRAVRTAIGIQGQQNVATRFAGVYGQRAVSTGTGFSKGQGGKPDVLLKLNPHPIAVEVKSVQAFTSGLRKVEGKKRKVRYPRLGYMKLYRMAWDDLTTYAKSHLMRRMIVVEYRVQGGENVYMWMTGREVDVAFEEKTTKSKPLTLNIGFWEMHRRGQVLRFRKGELERWLNAEGAVESSQTQLA